MKKAQLLNIGNINLYFKKLDPVVTEICSRQNSETPDRPAGFGLISFGKVTIIYSSNLNCHKPIMHNLIKNIVKKYKFWIFYQIQKKEKHAKKQGFFI